MVALDRFLLISKRAPPKQQPGPSQDRSDAPSSSQVPQLGLERSGRSSPSGLSSWRAPAERNPDLLCEKVLFEFAKPALELAEYHLIDLATGFSHGGFKSLAAARQYAREEAIPAWQVLRGNVRIEQHDPREADPIC